MSHGQGYKRTLSYFTPYPNLFPNPTISFRAAEYLSFHIKQNQNKTMIIGGKKRGKPNNILLTIENKPIVTGWGGGVIG